MKNLCSFFVFTFFISCKSNNKISAVSSLDYLKDCKIELTKEWPKNRTINLVFHGHSVPQNDLEKHSLQIRALAKKYDVGLVDSYMRFKQKVISGESISKYMSQVNHPNKKGN